MTGNCDFMLQISLKVRVIFGMMSVELSSMCKYNLCSVQFRIYCMIIDAVGLAAANKKKALSSYRTMQH